MAVFSFTSAGFPTGFRMTASAFEGLFDYVDETYTPTNIRFFDDANTFANFGGTGYQYQTFFGQVVDCIGGTVNTLLVREAGVNSLTVTGWALSAVTFVDLVMADNWVGLRNFMTSGNDRITGTLSNDELYAGAGHDTVNGGSGNDQLYGQAGNDTILGGNGNDALYGSSGRDTLTGGANADSFVFNSALNATTNVDTITDFSAVADTIRLDDAFFVNIGARGALGSARFVVGSEATDPADRIVYEQTTGRIFYDRDGFDPASSSSAAKVLFAQVDAGTVLTSLDFVIF